MSYRTSPWIGHTPGTSACTAMKSCLLNVSHMAMLCSVPLLWLTSLQPWQWVSLFIWQSTSTRPNCLLWPDMLTAQNTFVWTSGKHDIISPASTSSIILPFEVYLFLLIVQCGKSVITEEYMYVWEEVDVESEVMGMNVRTWCGRVWCRISCNSDLMCGEGLHVPSESSLCREVFHLQV